MKSRLLQSLLALCCLAFAGCQPEIGDSCTTSVDCAATGDRICDVTQPGGYCTIFNCEPGTCPEEAACIGYNGSPSTAPGCLDPRGGSRFQRSFCMRTCGGDGDCRSGYSCVTISAETGAVVLESGQATARVCMVSPPAISGAQMDASSEVCTGSDEMVPLPPGPDAGGQGGNAGASGGGAGGMSGGGAGGAGGVPAAGAGGVPAGGAGGTSGAAAAGGVAGGAGG